jgi:hypothetical protein
MLTVYVSYLQGYPLTFQIAGELSKNLSTIYEMC